jgi:hypothetical protein
MRSGSNRTEVAMNPSMLVPTAFDAHVDDMRRRAAASHRAGADRAPRRRTRPGAALAIRVAGPADQPAIARLAALEGRTAPAGGALVAEAGGVVVAALPLDGGRALGDPFEPTADLVRLLELRRRQLERGPEQGLGERLRHALASVLPAHGAASRRAA